MKIINEILAIISEHPRTGSSRVLAAALASARNENETFSQLNSITYIGVFLRLVTYSHLP